MLAISAGVATAALVPAPVRADVVPLSALEAAALRRRPALEAEAAHVEASHFDVERAKSAYFPRLSLEASGTLAPGGTLAKVVDTDGDAFWVASPRRVGGGGLFGGNAAVPQARSELGLDLRGNVYDFGRTAAAVRASEALASAATAEVKSVEFAILRGVRAAYLAWLASSELCSLSERAWEDAQARRARVELRIGEGVRPRSDLPAARADELLTQLELERSRGDLASARLGVEQAVGEPLPQGAEPERALLEVREVSAAPPSAESPLAAALELRGAAANANAALLDKANAPVLSGGVTAGIRTQGERPFPAYSVGLRLSFPLWDAGAARAGASAGRAQAAEAAARVRQQREQDRGTAERMRVDAANADARLKVAEQLLEIAAQRVQDAEQRYELGASDVDAIATARALLRRAETEAVLARIARAQAHLL